MFKYSINSSGLEKSHNKNELKTSRNDLHWWKLARCYKKRNYKESLHNFLQARINMILWFFNRNKSNSSVSLAGFQIQGKRFLGGHKETMQMSLHFSLISQALFTRKPEMRCLVPLCSTWRHKHSLLTGAQDVWFFSKYYILESGGFWY